MLQRARRSAEPDGRVLAEPLPARGTLSPRPRRRIPGHEPAQWELVSLLVRRGAKALALAGQPSIFIVGDRKQSIYRFRDADVAVLPTPARSSRRCARGRAHDARFRAASARCRDCSSSSTICSRKSPHRAARDDFTYGDERSISGRRAGLDSASRPALGIAAADDPVVCADAWSRRNPAAPSARTPYATSRPACARQARPGDIAILFRSRTSHREFEHALETRGIPTYVYKGLGFFDADEIKDVSALIRFLANPVVRPSCGGVPAIAVRPGVGRGAGAARRPASRRR